MANASTASDSAVLIDARSEELIDARQWDLRHPWLILFVVQLVMFGMGTQMSVRDFAGVVRMRLPVVIGLLCQFSIMLIVES